MQMINSIEIKNFRGINEGKLENLTPLTILVGANGCGKSTVLQSLLLGASADQDEALRWVMSKRLEGNHGAEWLFPNGLFRGRSEFVAYTPEKCVTTLVAADLSFEVQSMEKMIVSGNNGPYTAVGVGLDGSAKFRSALQEHYIPNVFHIEPNDSSLSVPLYTLFQDAVKLGRRDGIREVIQTLVPGLKDIILLASGDRPYVALEYSTGIVPVLHSGEGISQLVRESLELASRPDGVALMEEPETNKHPAAIFQTAKVIFAAVRRGIQVILSTHSLELIDALMEQAVTKEELAMVSLFKLQLRNGCLQTYRMDGKSIVIERFDIEEDLR